MSGSVTCPSCGRPRAATECDPDGMVDVAPCPCEVIWTAKNAELIREVMAHGLSRDQAIRLVDAFPEKFGTWQTPWTGREERPGSHLQVCPPPPSSLPNQQ